MTANRMRHWGDAHSAIGFEQTDAPVTNVLQAQGLPDGAVELSFRSTWAQAGASHSTDGALVLSRADAEALAAVLAPRDVARWRSNTLAWDVAGLDAPRTISTEGGNHVRAALMGAGWLPPDRLEAIAASWDGVEVKNGTDGSSIGEILREDFKNA